jgi:hypothetical protein
MEISEVSGGKDKHVKMSREWYCKVVLNSIHNGFKESNYVIKGRGTK